MARSSFVSFHYQNDYWRVQQVLQMGAIEGQEVLSPQRWESVKARGAKAIQDWIDKEMAYKRGVIVLIGSQTASRPWVKYEIQKAWNAKKPLVGIRIHGLKNNNLRTSTAGPNPFAQISISNSTKTLADYVPVHDPAGRDSTQVYASIKNNVASWIASGYKRP
ncbi:MTH538 TIR-like domain [Klenkia terrae]|uniref:MTH538 TIR-like domain n=1 Tax=Blastococcus aggregatus TaxID=38502 RepID=A0A285V8X5_9ACTN|nr:MULTISPECIES: TIR domain-containing protein [Geodermatophilaceae]SOC50397.1 MTH538 TIR-like domain [Blastococcus aggregatus]SSC25072.1 MTH538 TIR-like domain [Klenkia terrae]